MLTSGLTLMQLLTSKGIDKHSTFIDGDSTGFGEDPTPMEWFASEGAQPIQKIFNALRSIPIEKHSMLLRGISSNSTNR